MTSTHCLVVESNGAFVAMVTLVGVTEAVADAAALALLKLFSRIAREQAWEFGVSVAMRSPALAA